MITQNIIGYQTSAQGTDSFSATNPESKETLTGNFPVATPKEVDLAVQKSWLAWKTYRYLSGKQKSAFLNAIAQEIENLGDDLVIRVMQESGLPEGRVRGERGRTCNQLRLFAKVVEEGSWVEARIDKAQPDRQPIPKADIRRMLQSTGPVVVFTASNFPLAFSTAGGDTASALAAGCPVIVKGHPSHPGTNVLISTAIQKAAEKTNMPDGVFSSLNSKGHEVGIQLVKHPLVKSVAFTGSLRGGKALYDIANQREEPIPVFAEMGSVNPVFLLPEKIKSSTKSLATQLANSVNLGAGQFCTNPGLLLALDNEHTTAFLGELKAAFEKLIPSTMLNQGIFANYNSGKAHCLNIDGVKAEYVQANGETEHWKGYPAVASVSGEVFLDNSHLQEEVFGPFTLLVLCKNKAQMEAIAENLKGQLTATLMGHDEELSAWKSLFHILQEKAGRVIFNGVPTGVEVCHSMQHGGPFPATTDGRYTSVGTAAIKRFARPVAFQSCLEDLLPEALKSENPLNIWRTIDGAWTKEGIKS